jgi:hypothetical protein
MHRKYFVFVTVAMLFACGTRGQTPAPTGADLYANHCASCHGSLGEGDGPLADVMRVTVPNIRTLAMRNDGQFPADDVRAFVDGRAIPMSHGDRMMPIWGNVFGWGVDEEDTEEEHIAQRIDAIVEHVRVLQYR